MGPEALSSPEPEPIVGCGALSSPEPEPILGCGALSSPEPEPLPAPEVPPAMAVAECEEDEGMASDTLEDESLKDESMVAAGTDGPTDGVEEEEESGFDRFRRLESKYGHQAASALMGLVQDGVHFDVEVGQWKPLEELVAPPLPAAASVSCGRSLPITYECCHACAHVL